MAWKIIHVHSLYEIDLTHSFLILINQFYKKYGPYDPDISIKNCFGTADVCFQNVIGLGLPINPIGNNFDILVYRDILLNIQAKCL